MRFLTAMFVHSLFSIRMVPHQVCKFLSVNEDIVRQAYQLSDDNSDAWPTRWGVAKVSLQRRHLIQDVWYLSELPFVIEMSHSFFRRWLIFQSAYRHQFKLHYRCVAQSCAAWSFFLCFPWYLPFIRQTCLCFTRNMQKMMLKGAEVKRYFYEIFVTNVSPVFLESSIHTGWIFLKNVSCR